MYRIFCESYNNFVQSFTEDNARLRIMKPFELIVDTKRYNKEKLEQSELYKKVSEIIYYMEKNVKKFPKFKAFLWILESRNITPKKYNVLNQNEIEEQLKLANSFLKLAYWY